ncbi:hypothetical protein [Prauserella muralis]|uniref:Uncharacterized protein n=1 Tax=Prauserella muralis TaxID=588067 RepID=A0A2V4AL81_9PSEU|nr:hypothetical protein [Prauserella muralis]PXY21045.1 hypothetical protein BAY60_26590 [Prauserella muralis]TWE30120.1 hypothetical protein FHX69_2817 [Prauserella muralis]
MGGYGVEVASLVSAGERFIELADEASQAQAEFSGGIQRHEGANEGFTTTGTAASLATLWEYHIDDLSKRTAVAGGLLAEAADGYERMEDAVVETLPPLSSAD